MKVLCQSVNYNTYQGYADGSNGALVPLVNANVQFQPVIDPDEPNALRPQNFSITFERVTDEVNYFPGKVYDLTLTPVED